MKPLRLYYKDEVRKWLRSNPSKVVTLFKIATLFWLAFVNAANMKTDPKFCEKTGIWPTNEGVITDDDFLPAETTYNPVADIQAPEPGTQTDPSPVDEPQSQDGPTVDEPPENNYKETGTKNNPLPQCS